MYKDRENPNDFHNVNKNNNKTVSRVIYIQMRDVTLQHSNEIVEMNDFISISLKK